MCEKKQKPRSELENEAIGVLNALELSETMQVSLSAVQHDMIAFIHVWLLSTWNVAGVTEELNFFF